MWIGGYDDWTPAEQRDWDRDMEENAKLYEERQKQKERELNEKEKKEQVTLKADNALKEPNEKECETKTWMDWA